MKIKRDFSVLEICQDEYEKIIWTISNDSTFTIAQKMTGLNHEGGYPSMQSILCSVCFAELKTSLTLLFAMLFPSRAPLSDLVMKKAEHREKGVSW